MIRTPNVAVTVTDGLLWLLNSQDGTPVLSYEASAQRTQPASAHSRRC